MSEYIMSHTGKELDDAINKVRDGYILPSETVNITENISNMDITNGKWLNVNVRGQYYATSFTPSANTQTVSFDIGFEPKLFIVTCVNSFTNSTTTMYITTVWYCADLTGAGYGEYAGGLTVHKESSAGRLTSYNANDFYSYANGVVTINDTSHYFKASTLYRVFAMA